MKNNKKNIVIILIFIIVIILLITFAILNAKKVKNEKKEDEKLIVDESKIYDENITLNELKEEYKVKGEDEIYQIEKEEDGRNVITVKANISYKVAFAGMIKNQKPELNEIDEIFNKNHPKENGIWINPKDSEKILKHLNDENIFKTKYKVDEKGFLKILDSKNQTKYDKKIIKAINGKKQHILSISSICYMIDPIDGKIIDNPYNELDKYQTYEYFEDENKQIIFITENFDKVNSKEEIIKSLIDLIDVL